MIFSVILALVASIAPGLIWVWIFRSREWHHPEPWRLVALCFGLGLLFALPTAFLVSYVPSGEARSLLVTPVVEELVKMLAFVLAVWRSPELDEPGDGLVYAAAVAFGFATVESVGYGLILLLRPEALGLEAFGSPLEVSLIMAVLRGLITGPAHAIWACLWGLPLVYWRLGRPGSGWWVVGGLVASVIAHSLFNALTLLGDSLGDNVAFALMVVFVVCGLVAIFSIFRRLESE